MQVDTRLQSESLTAHLGFQWSRDSADEAGGHFRYDLLMPCPCLHGSRCPLTFENVCESVNYKLRYGIARDNITKYGSTLYIGMDKVSEHHGHTFENFRFKFSMSM